MARPAREVEDGGERSRREEREKRILDAASALAQRWGYRKTTLDDIARESGVPKGTIYLSWSTREKLFLALIDREQVRLFDDIFQRMESEPGGMSLIGLVKHSILASLENPVARALIFQDMDFLGKTIMREIKVAGYMAQLQQYVVLLQTLREIGVVRADLELQEQAYALVSASWGPLLINPLLPEDTRLSDEGMVSVIITTLRALLEPAQSPTQEQRARGERAFREYLEEVRRYRMTE